MELVAINFELSSIVITSLGANGAGHFYQLSSIVIPY